MEEQVPKQNIAGVGAREMARKRRVGRRSVGVAALFVLVIIGLVNFSNLRHGNIIVTLSCLIGLAIISRGVIPDLEFVKKREDDATRGAEAEEDVASILDCLRNENQIVVHAINTGRGNIDHVVVRRDGAVFILETKSQRGKVSELNGRLMLNGKAPDKDFVGQAQRNSIWLRDRIHKLTGATPWVNAAIVFPNAFVSVRSQLGPCNVDVINAKYLERWMAKAPANREIGRRLAEKWETLAALLTA